MALEATHMRFALEFKDYYQVQDLEKYIVGSIYPDSRYVSGIDRELTHDDKFLLAGCAKDDFHKGWQIHFLADKIGRDVTEKNFADLLDLYVDTNKSGNRWETFSAIKIIQDIHDMQMCDIQVCVRYLENYIFNPNNESPDDIKKYNQLMIDLYKGKVKITTADTEKMWLGLGIDMESGKQMKEQADAFLQDNNMINRIENLYDETLREMELFFNN